MLQLQDYSPNQSRWSDRPTTTTNPAKPNAEKDRNGTFRGFRPGRGTADMLVIIQVLIEKVMGIGGQALVNFIDYSKAFNLVLYNCLILCSNSDSQKT